MIISSYINIAIIAIISIISIIYAIFIVKYGFGTVPVTPIQTNHKDEMIEPCC